MKKKKIYGFAMACLVGVTLQAQTVTYFHDATKLNQITVMESGSGSLTPAYFYNLLHEKYAASAAVTSKTLQRNAAVLNLQPQKKMAEEIDSALVKRALVESLNIADRQGGALDMAWKAEGSKITTKLQDYQNNINRLSAMGVTREEREYWDTYHKMYSFSIQAVRQAYLPNAKRKQQYLQIYRELCDRNEQLVVYTAQVYMNSQMQEQLQTRPLQLIDKRASIAQSAKHRWKAAMGNKEVSQSTLGE